MFAYDPDVFMFNSSTVVPVTSHMKLVFLSVK